jgi:hypothetical protein
MVMTHPAKLPLPLQIAVALTLACGGAQPPASTEIAATAADAAVIATDGVPKITADEAVYEFGAIAPTDTVEHVFKIRNAGTADLKVERVQKT